MLGSGKTRRQKNALKAAPYPFVQCTLCWAAVRLALALRLLFQLLVESILDYPIMRSYPLRTWYQMAAKEKVRSICSKISAHHLKRFENSTNMSSKGRFWYDATCGAWGVEGGPTAGSIYPFNHENDKDKPNEMDFPLIKTISHGFIWT